MPKKKQKIETKEIPGDVLLNVVSLCGDAPTIRKLRLVCTRWNRFILATEHLTKILWEDVQTFYDDSLNQLNSSELSQWCRIALQCEVKANGTFNSLGRKIQDVDQKHNYQILLQLFFILHNALKNIDIELEPSNYKFTSLRDVRGFLSLLLGAHSEDPIRPIVLKHDTIHTRVEFDTQNDGDNDDDGWEPFKKDESEGSIAFQTVKKLFRFPDLEEENTLDTFRDQCKYLVENSRDAFGQTWLEAHQSLFDMLKNSLEDVRVIRMTNYASEEVSLYFLLGKKGSYLAGFWWMKERDS